MSRSRARIAHFMPAVLTAFLVGGVLPRAVVLVHRHDGAGRPHVHASDAEFSPCSSVRIHRPDRSPRAHAPGLWAAGADGWHAHSHDPFQEAAMPAVARALRSDAVAPVRPVPSSTASASALLFRAARAPPSAA